MSTLLPNKTLTLLICSIWLCTACNNENTEKTKNSDFFVPSNQGPISQDLFEINRLVQVDIQMLPADFEILRNEGRSLDTALSECPSMDFEYTDFVASVTIDGESLENVAIRKKGYLGSITPSRPSLKLNFGTHQEGRTFKTMKRMTLNNDRQDPSHSHQCMAYDLYRQAGLAAPRCNLAQVKVNGEYLGIYSNIESIKKPFLKRNFSDDSGNLYEAQVADFGSQLNDKFELKTNKKTPDRSDLEEVSDALLLDDQQFLEKLPLLIDLNEFITFWAIDTLLGHWDSATGNANNYYIYHNPGDDLFHFIPWGTDAAFTGTHAFKPDSGPLYRNQSIASRLYAIESSKAQYHNKINELLNGAWDESELLTKIKKLQTLSETSDEAILPTTTFISGSENTKSQRDLLTSALAGQEPEENEYVLPDIEINCDEDKKLTSLSASFETNPPSDQGIFKFINAEGKEVIANLLYTTMGPENTDSIVYKEDNSTLPGNINLTLIGVDAADQFKPYVLQLFIEKPDYVPGDHPLHGIVTNMMLFEVLNTHPLDLKLLGLGHSGSINLTNTGLGTQGSPIKGSITAQIALLKEAHNNAE